MNSSLRRPVNARFGWPIFSLWVALALASVDVVLAAEKSAPLPAGWEVTGFGRGRTADPGVSVQGDRWNLKSGAGRSVVAYQTLSGDVTVTAQILEARGAPAARAGLKVWSNVSATAGHLGLLVDPQGQKVMLLWDEETERARAPVDLVQEEGLGFPLWLRLTRTGSVFRAAYSRDGRDWRPVGPPIQTFWAGNRPEIFAGLYSENDSEQRLSDVRVARGGSDAEPPLPEGWTAAVQGQPNFAGSATHESGRWRIQGVTTRGRGGYHSVTVLRSVPPGVQLTGQLRLPELGDPRAAGGLVVRAHGMDAGVMIFPAGGQLRLFARRTADGRLLQNKTLPLPPGLVGQTDIQLRLALVGSRVAAFQRTGAGEWNQVGDVFTVPELADELKGGLELYSESAARKTLRAEFTGVEVVPITSLPIRAAPAAPTPVAAAAPVPAPTSPSAATKAAAGPVRPAVIAPYRPPPSRDSEVGVVRVILTLMFWVTLVGVLLIIRPFNRLVRLRNVTRKGWAQIDVQLKRRHDLIQNLVEVVKGYAKHEHTTLEAVTQARAAAVSAESPATSAAAEDRLNGSLRGLYAVVERYPDLKADRQFTALHESLTGTEDKIASAREAYNEEVVAYNNVVESFPSNLVARIFRFKAADFFRISAAAEREASKAAL